MTRLPLAAFVVLALLAVRTARGQGCSEPHYRWSEKVDSTFASKPPTTVAVSDILTWSPRALTAQDRCAARAGRELNLYSVTAFVRRRHEASVGLRLLKDRFVGRRPDSFQRSGSSLPTLF